MGFHCCGPSPELALLYVEELSIICIDRGQCSNPETTFATKNRVTVTSLLCQASTRLLNTPYREKIILQTENFSLSKRKDLVPDTSHDGPVLRLPTSQS